MSNRNLGFILLIVGLILVGFGLSATSSLTESVHEGMTGRFTDKTTWFLVGGGALALIGLGLAFSGGRRSLNA